MNFQEKLMLLRSQNKLSQEELAEQIGISRQAVAKWETGKAIPDIGNLIQLSRVFNISIDRLVKEEENNCSLEFLPVEKESLSDFIDFLLKAKISTYAGNGAEIASTRPASHDLRYADGKYLYYDSYLGSEQFAGEEGVWKDNKPIWAMNYSGRVLHELFSGDFLKKCLSAVSKEFPFRGPALYKEGEYTYHCSICGDYPWFQGTEEIFCRDIKVYECCFHGGKIL